MEMSVADYARRRGVSRQRALAMIRAGQLPAKRVGRAWVIDQKEVNLRHSYGRPLGPRMIDALVGALSGRPLAGLSSEERHFTSKYLERLRGADDPARLLHSWMRSRQRGLVEVAANPADLAEIARDPRLVPSGISDERSRLSAVRELEGYIASDDLPALLRDNLLIESDAPNVRLHVVEKLPDRPLPLGLLLADLADWNGPREDARVIELLRGIRWP